MTPEADDTTIFTSWFGDKQADTWQLIATFRRPKTNTHLRRFHSFLENFDPRTGHRSRRGQHGDIWVRDTEGAWHECLTASFSVDATGRGGHRLDFTGGTTGPALYLCNCGFFSETTAPGDIVHQNIDRRRTAHDQLRAMETLIDVGSGHRNRTITESSWR